MSTLAVERRAHHPGHPTDHAHYASTPASASSSFGPPPPHPPSSQSRSLKRSAASIVEDNLGALPSNDSNAWYYPASYPETSDGEDLPVGISTGNWGRKRLKSARWIKKGKMAAWGPAKEEWQWEENARKRLKSLLPQPARSPSPPILPHLRSPSPPLTAPYPPVTVQHPNYTSFVMDPSVQHSFRSEAVGDISRAIGNLIEGEGGLKRALGRLWQVLSEDPDQREGEGSKPVNGVIKEQNSPDGMDETRNGLQLHDDARPNGHTSDNVSAMHKIFVSDATNYSSASAYDGNLSRPMEVMVDGIETLKDLLDDSREYVERLEEIREGLGAAIGQRDALWTLIREKALQEMEEQEAAS